MTSVFIYISLPLCYLTAMWHLYLYMWIKMSFVHCIIKPSLCMYRCIPTFELVFYYTPPFSLRMCLGHASNFIPTFWSGIFYIFGLKMLILIRIFVPYNICVFPWSICISVQIFSGEFIYTIFLVPVCKKKNAFQRLIRITILVQDILWFATYVINYSS